MKTNPRIRYFCPDYLLDFLDEEPETSEDESEKEATQELEQVEKEVQKRKVEVVEEPLAYSIEHIRDEPQANLGFDLFSYFRRKSTDRPRSALAYLQQVSTLERVWIILIFEIKAQFFRQLCMIFSVICWCLI